MRDRFELVSARSDKCVVHVRNPREGIHGTDGADSPVRAVRRTGNRAEEAHGHVEFPVVIQSVGSEQLRVQILGPACAVTGAHDAAKQVHRQETVRHADDVLGNGVGNPFGQREGRCIGIIHAHIPSVPVGDFLYKVGAWIKRTAPVQTISGYPERFRGGAAKLKEFAVGKTETIERVAKKGTAAPVGAIGRTPDFDGAAVATNKPPIAKGEVIEGFGAGCPEPAMRIRRDPGATRRADHVHPVPMSAQGVNRVCTDGGRVPIHTIRRCGDEHATLLRCREPKPRAVGDRIELWAARQPIAPNPLINRSCLNRQNS